VNGSGGGSAAALANMSPARAWIPGRLGRAVDLGGAGYLAAPATASWNALAGVTVAAWVQRRSDDARLAVVLRRATAADPTREHLSLDLRDNRLGLSLATNAAGPQVRAPMPTPSGRWVHVAGTFDGTTVRVYQDGVQVATQAFSGKIAADSTPISVGAALVAGGEDDFFLGGLIDEIAAWGRALGPAEVARLARGEQPAAR
jgi:hypothetical protein